MVEGTARSSSSRLGRVVTVGFCVFLGALMVVLVVSFPVAHNWGRWQVERAAAEVARKAGALPDVVAVHSEVYLTYGEAWGSAGPNYSARNYTAELEADLTSPDRAEQIRAEVTRLAVERGGPNEWAVTVRLVLR